MSLPQKYKVNDDECIEFKRKAIARRDVAKALKALGLDEPVRVTSGWVL